MLLFASEVSVWMVLVKFSREYGSTESQPAKPAANLISSRPFPRSIELDEEEVEVVGVGKELGKGNGDREDVMEE